MGCAATPAVAQERLWFPLLLRWCGATIYLPRFLSPRPPPLAPPTRRCGDALRRCHWLMTRWILINVVSPSHLFLCLSLFV